MNGFTHIDAKGKAKMVDVTMKEETERSATAFCEVLLPERVFEAVSNNQIAKGDVLTVAKIAGIQASKKTHELIPLCHNIFISGIDLMLELNSEKKTVEITAAAKTISRTGIEMEALTAVSIAALTVYDMCKAIDKAIVISNVRLIAKDGGKSGSYRAEQAGFKK